MNLIKILCLQTLSSVENSPPLVPTSSGDQNQNQEMQEPERSQVQPEKLFHSQDPDLLQRSYTAGDRQQHRGYTAGDQLQHSYTAGDQLQHSFAELQQRSQLQPDKLFHSRDPGLMQRSYTAGDQLQHGYNIEQQQQQPQLQHSYTVVGDQLLHSYNESDQLQHSYNADQLQQLSYSSGDPLQQSYAAGDPLQQHRLSLQPGYQFIEDYEHISPRLIHNANMMHHINSVQRTSLLGTASNTAFGRLMCIVSQLVWHKTHQSAMCCMWFCNFVLSDPTVSSVSSGGGGASMTPELQEFLQSSLMLQSSLQSRQQPRPLSAAAAGHRSSLPCAPPPAPPPATTTATSATPTQGPPMSSFQIVKKNSSGSPLKGILVKHKPGSKSMSSLAVASAPPPGPAPLCQVASQSQGRLNRASLHLPLTTCRVSPPRPRDTALDLTDNNNTVDSNNINNNYYNNKSDVACVGETKQHYPGDNSLTESFTWSEIGVQTEVHYEYVHCLLLLLSLSFF